MSSESFNRYSADWIETFLTAFDPAQTAREVEFLRRQLPLGKFRRILDLCCGAGRHAIALANVGYDVIGVERDPSLIARARAAGLSARFVESDARELCRIDGPFDAVICMWQSFGYFDSAANDALLSSIASKLNDRGRFVLDIYHGDFFNVHQGTRESTVRGRTVVETKHVKNGRLHVHLAYHDGGASDDFDWELFTPESIRDRAAGAGLSMISACKNFDEHQPASPTAPRMQITFELADRTGSHSRSRAVRTADET